MLRDDLAGQYDLDGQREGGSREREYTYAYS